MGIVVIGAVFVDIKGNPLSTYIPGGRNAGRMEQVHKHCADDYDAHKFLDSFPDFTLISPII